MICFSSGNIHLLDPDTGQDVTSFDVGQPVTHRPFREGDKMYFGGLDGTVHVVDLKRLP